MNHGRQTWVRDRMAERGVEVSPETVRKWYSGEARPKPDKMKVLADLFEVREEWLSLGIMPDMPVEDQKARNAAVSGSVNMVTGFLQMAGATCAYPDDDKPEKSYTDLHAIIDGRHKAINVTLGRPDGDTMRFQVPTEYEKVVVIGAIQTGFSRAELFIIPSEVIRKGASRSGYIEVVVSKPGSEWTSKGGSLARIRKLDDIA